MLLRRCLQKSNFYRRVLKPPQARIQRVLNSNSLFPLSLSQSRAPPLSFFFSSLPPRSSRGTWQQRRGEGAAAASVLVHGRGSGGAGSPTSGARRGSSSGARAGEGAALGGSGAGVGGGEEIQSAVAARGSRTSGAVVLPLAGHTLPWENEGVVAALVRGRGRRSAVTVQGSGRRGANPARRQRHGEPDLGSKAVLLPAGHALPWEHGSEGGYVPTTSKATRSSLPCRPLHALPSLGFH